MDDLALARTAAQAAAAIVADWADRLETVNFKGVGNPVTEADLQAETAILDLITRHRPADGVLGEEGASRPGSSGRRWVIDPLDGTVNFLHGFPQVAVSIALEDEQGPLVGVVRDVFRNEEFAAQRGSGTMLDEKPARVSTRDNLSDALVATGFSYDRQERWQEYGRVLGEMLGQVRGLRRGGSAALDLAWVACGRLDAYWELRLGPWDVAAGYLLVAESGGTVTSLDGSPATHLECVAATSALHTDFRLAVAKAVAG